MQLCIKCKVFGIWLLVILNNNKPTNQSPPYLIKLHILAFVLYITSLIISKHQRAAQSIFAIWFAMFFWPLRV